MNTPLRIEIRANDRSAAVAAAACIADRLRRVDTGTGWLTLACSGGRTPAAMLTELARHDLAWDRLHVFQVDERLVGDEDPRRNSHQLRSALGERVGSRLHLIDAGSNDDPEDIARRATADLASVIGPNGAIDVVHLGLGDDGHTASLVPGDRALSISTLGYAHTGPYQGTRRITLTYPSVEQAGYRCWLATGESKSPMAARLVAADPAIPAGRLGTRPGLLVTDQPGAPR